MDFATYAKNHVGAHAFLPDPAKPEEQIFTVSLASVKALIGRPDIFKNAGLAGLKVEAGFVELMTPDAHADHVDGVHYLVMHQALLATIIEFALFLFTQSYLLPDIGDATGEASPSFDRGDAPGLHALRITLDGSIIDPDKDRVRVPHCADRHVAAVYMALLMSRFVWFHELAHCINGHVLYLRHRDLNKTLIGAAPPLSLVALKHKATGLNEQRQLRHALELDADATAFEWLLRIQNAGAENITGLLGFDEAQRFKMTVIGTYMMTWLFEEYQRFADARHGLTHPAPRARLTALTRFMDEAGGHAGIAQALTDIHVTLEQLSEKIDGFHFTRDDGPPHVMDAALSAALEPFRFR